MTRAITLGAETGDSAGFDAYYGTIGTSIVRTGNYAYLPNYGSYSAIPIPEGDQVAQPVFWRFGLYINWYTNANRLCWVIAQDSTSCKAAIGLRNGYFCYFRGTTSIGIGTWEFPLQTWGLVELRLQCANSAYLRVYVDGTLREQWDAVDTNATTAAAAFCSLSAPANGSIVIDDLAVNTNIGSVDNSYPGDGRIVLLKPNAAGDKTDLNSSGSDANWENVDEFPYDGDTSYNSGSGVGDYDLYNLDNITGTGKQILRAFPIVYAKKTGVFTTASIGIKTSGSEFWSDDIGLGNSYGLFYGDMYINDPTSGSPWEIEDLNSLQIGFKVT